jgi:chorismate synthase
VKIEITSVPEPDAALGDQLVQLQKAVWGSEPDDVLPSWRFVVAPRTGGELLVAHAGGELVGFALCSPGIEEHETYLYLDLLGVHPSHRHARVGEQLMRALVEAALKRAIFKVRWTFDPLEGANANLYLAKLGARGIRFLPNLYGSMARAGQQGERSDRLLAELDLMTRLSGERMRQPRPQLVLLPSATLPDVLPARIALAVPASYAKLRVSHPEPTREVRLGTGRILEQLFAAGFTITDFERGEHTNHLVAERAPAADSSADGATRTSDADGDDVSNEDIDDETARVIARHVARHLEDREQRKCQWAWELFTWEFRTTRPEAAWRILLIVWPLVKSNDDALGLLAAGPLEDLIADHGARLIDRIEDLARRDIDFARLLGGVWQSSTPDDIWSRIEKVRHHVW